MCAQPSHKKWAEFIIFRNGALAAFFLSPAQFESETEMQGASTASAPVAAPSSSSPKTRRAREALRYLDPLLRCSVSATELVLVCEKMHLFVREFFPHASSLFGAVLNDARDIQKSFLPVKIEENYMGQVAADIREINRKIAQALYADHHGKQNEIMRRNHLHLSYLAEIKRTLARLTVGAGDAGILMKDPDFDEKASDCLLLVT